MDDNLLVCIISLNCYGIKTSLYQVYELCEVADIVLLQETWLFTHELSIFSTIHPEFEENIIMIIIKKILSPNNECCRQ